MWSNVASRGPPLPGESISRIRRARVPFNPRSYLVFAAWRFADMLYQMQRSLTLEGRVEMSKNWFHLVGIIEKISDDTRRNCLVN